MDHRIEQLSQDLARAKYATETQKRYRVVAEELVKHVGKPIDEVSRDELRQFVDALLAREGSASNKKHKLCGLRFLYKRTLGRPEMVSFFKLPKVHSPLPVILSKSEVGRVLNAIRDPRYQAMAMVMYGTGLRIAEAVNLCVDDIDRARGVIRVRQGKGGKPREVKLSRNLYDWLRQYWACSRPPPPYLFSDGGGCLPARSTIRDALRAASKRANVRKSVTPHVLRHSFATHLLEAGVDVRVVSALLGHASVEATARYARVTEKLVRRTPSPIDLLPGAHR